MKKFMISSVAVFAAFAFAGSVSAVSATEIYTPTSGYLKVGSGMGAKVSQMANVMAAQKALNICTNSSLVVDGKFGPLTTGVFKAFQASKGIAQDGIIGPVTAAQLAACSGDSSTPSTGSTTLNGGAGSITVDDTAKSVEDTLKEGEEDVAVLGLDIEAEGSDVAITNVKVTLQNQDNASSERIEKYLDEVSVWFKGKKVGSVDADEFSRNTVSGQNDEYTKTISVSGVVIGEDDSEFLYVGVSAISNIDSDDLGADWKVTASDFRYKDATGAILTDSSSEFEVFTFEDEDADDDLSVKSSSNDPDSATLQVEEDESSDEYMVFAFKLDVDEDSSDISILELPIEIKIDNAGSTVTDADEIIDEVVLKVGSKEYSSDEEDTDVIFGGSGTATYTFEFDNDEFVIDGGDDQEVEVVVTFAKQENVYATGTTIEASVDGSAVDAEGADDLNASGSSTGDVHTLEVDAPVAKLVSRTLKLSNSIDGVATDEEDVYVAEFVFEVEAGDEDVYISDDATDFTQAVTGGATVLSRSIDADDSNIDEDNSYRVDSGSKERFTYSVFLKGNSATGRVQLTAIPYGFSDATADDESITSGLSTFQTNSLFLAK